MSTTSDTAHGRVPGLSDWPSAVLPRLTLLDEAPRLQAQVVVVAVEAATRADDAAGVEAPAWTRAVAPAVPAAMLAAHGLTDIDEQTAGLPSAWLRSLPAPTAAPTGEDGEIVAIAVPPAAGLPADTLVLLGLSDRSTPTAARRAAAGLGRRLRGRTPVSVLLPAVSESVLRAFAEGYVLGAYEPPAVRSKSATRPAAAGETPAATASEPADVVLDLPEMDAAGRAARSDALRLGLVHARATAGARDLAVTPSNVKDPSWVADRARGLQAVGVRVRVRDVDELVAEGFGGIVTVGAGSARPPALVELDYVPAGAAPTDPPVVVIGKGITYDTGGLSIKPRESMVPMKTDMSGAAAVLETLRACADAGVARRVVGLLPLAENAVGASSYRPSDVVTHYGGRTVEVTNTDAEGRMVLADALAYAVARLNPAVVVDIATLTGAATLGLGKRHAALFATDEALAASLVAAGEASGERAWRMPLVEDYRPALDSAVADVRHVPEQAIGGGAITAALFLREFTAGLVWAHLDIAGTARADKDEYEVCRGATGWGARLLLRWLESMTTPDIARGTAPTGQE